MLAGNRSPCLASSSSLDGEPPAHLSSEVVCMMQQNATTWTDPSGQTWNVPGSRQRLARWKNKRHKAIADFVMERAGYACQECGETYPLHIDHIIPRRAGGTSHPNNLQVLCASCHTRKTMISDGDLWPTSEYPTFKQQTADAIAQLWGGA